jgi:Na+/H+ antiporter NhaD/arsenite permease-like protein
MAIDSLVPAVFFLVYAGMVLGEIPGLALDRTGIALLGAIALIASGRITLEAAWNAVDVPTIALLLGLMVVSAQLRLGGFYTALTRRLGAGDHAPATLLGLVVLAAGLLSAVLANDIVCLAMAPVLVEVCARKGLAPVPFLLALACASNVGSAATLIGNPQNMLIGQTLRLSFAGYLLDGGVPALLGLSVVWALVGWRWRGRWSSPMPVPAVAAPRFDRWQSAKGLAIALVLTIAFVAAPWPREVLALVAAGVLLVSRQMASREMLGLVDWHLIVLFASLFVVNAAVARSGLLEHLLARAAAAGVSPAHPAALFGITALLSNLVSNVPAVMLLLPAARHDLAGPVLALSSTLAGNLLVVGSIANIIVVDQAARLGVAIDWRTHARVGVPVTLVTLAIAAAWLAWLA